MNDRRTPHEIKEQAIMCFKQMARPKYDEGQAKAEASGEYPNLDERPDLVTQARYEVLDLWFYLDSLNHQTDLKDTYIEEVELELDRMREEVKKLRECADGLMLEVQRLEGEG